MADTTNLGTVIVDYVQNIRIEGILHPEYFYFLIPVAIVLFILLRYDFVKTKEEESTRKRRKRFQWFVLLTRLLLAALIITILAVPFAMQEKFIDGDPVVHVIVDKSRSMELFENSADPMIEQLRDRVEVEVTEIDSADRSNVGDAILSSLRPFESVLLFSDGNANDGAEVGDVAVYARTLNATVHRVGLDANQQDVAVSIIGPAKVLEGTENEFFVRLLRVDDDSSIRLQVLLNGESIYDESTTEDAVKLTRRLDAGHHKFEARIVHDDYFEENNVFYKVVKSVDRPKILYVSEDSSSPMQTLLEQQFEVTRTSRLEQNSQTSSQVDPYYAVIVNNEAKENLEGAVDGLTDYLADGNGMLTIGGRNSFNYGEYRHSQFESLLPTQTGRADRKEGDVNVVLVIDISGSTASTVDIEKALALGVLEDLDPLHNIGVVAFNTQAFLVSPLSAKATKTNLIDRVSKLKDGGGTQIHAGLLQAVDMLSQSTGSKNIILISDGRTQGEQNTYEAAKLASNMGIRTYTIGVGEKTKEEVMQTVADLTTGIYFHADELSRLRILFGDLEAERDKDFVEVIPINTNHFITSNLGDVTAQVSGWNEVVPKTSGNMLVTTSAGDPLLTVWRFGLGRVASLSTDDGSSWAGDLLNRANSKLLLRSVNWVIGEPDRKEDDTVTIRDGRIGIPTDMTLRSSSPPVAEGFAFYKLDENTYSSSFVSDTLGFSEVLGVPFATNYPSELQYLGLSGDLDPSITTTGGTVFEPNQIDDIVEKTKARAQRTVRTEQPVRYPFVVAAILILLFEIAVRRLLRKE